MTVRVYFLDACRETTEKPDPKYPDGIDLDLAHGAPDRCCRNTPYPAPRCGIYQIVCDVCKLEVSVAVRGTADDPRTVTLPCKAH